MKFSILDLMVVTFFVALLFGAVRVLPLTVLVPGLCVGAYFGWRSAGTRGRTALGSAWVGAKASALAVMMQARALMVHPLPRAGKIWDLIIAVPVVVPVFGIVGAVAGAFANVAWHRIYGSKSEV